MLIVFSAAYPDSYPVVSSISRYIVGMIRHSHQLSNGASAGLRHYFVFTTKPQFGVKRPCSTKARLGGELLRCARRDMLLWKLHRFLISSSRELIRQKKNRFSRHLSPSRKLALNRYLVAASNATRPYFSQENNAYSSFFEIILKKIICFY